jgi:hypothetical protein
MASFVPYYRKKQLQLRELEGQLLAELQKGAAEEIILRAAEEVRRARLGAFKEKIAKLPPSEKNAPAVKRLQSKIEELRTTDVAAVIEEYRRRAAHLKGPVRISRAPRRGSW